MAPQSTTIYIYMYNDGENGDERIGEMCIYILVSTTAAATTPAASSQQPAANGSSSHRTSPPQTFRPFPIPPLPDGAKTFDSKERNSTNQIDFVAFCSAVLGVRVAACAAPCVWGVCVYLRGKKWFFGIFGIALTLRLLLLLQRTWEY